MKLIVTRLGIAAALVLLACSLQAQVASSAAGKNPCSDPTATLVSAAGSTSGTSAVQIVAASGTAKVYICSLIVVGVSGTTPTFSLEYGTGTACAVGTTVIIGAWTTTANTVYPFQVPVFVAPGGSEICYLDTGTSPVQRYAITYVQQ